MNEKLTPDEVLAIQLSLQQTIEDMDAVYHDKAIKLTQQARKDLEEMRKHTRAALNKIAKASKKFVELTPYKEGDENEFIHH